MAVLSSFCKLSRMIYMSNKCPRSNPAFRLNSINFYVTHWFFVTFFPEESNVSPSSLLPLPYRKEASHA